jgi:purine-binding chemotaxis protein CheW
MKTETTRLVIFKLGDGLFAMDIFAVHRVVRYGGASAVTDVPGWIEGVLEYEGQVIPIVDLRRRMELPRDGVKPETRVLVLNTFSGWVGAVVDAVLEVAVVPVSDIAPPPPLFRGLSAEFMKGIARLGGERLAVMLDADRVLESTDRIILEPDGAELGAGG